MSGIAQDEERNELIFYYKARPDLPTKSNGESGLPTDETVDLEIILLGPKREQLMIKDKRLKRSTKLRRLKSKSDGTNDLDDDYENDADVEEESKEEDSNRAPASKVEKTPVEAATDDDDEDYLSADEIKSDAVPKCDTGSKPEEQKSASRIPRIKPTDSQSKRPSSKGSRRKKSDLLDRLESLFNSTDTPARGNSGSNVDYMDYF